MKKQFEIKPIEKPDKIKSYWLKQWRVGLMIIITGLLYNASMSVGPVILGKIIDFILEKRERNLIITWIVLYIAIILAIQFARYLKRFYVRVFSNRTNTVMRLMVYNNIMNRDIESLKGEKTGDLMTKAISDVGACVEGMRKFTTELFDTGVLMVAYFITLLIHDVKLTIIACAFIPVAMFLAEKLKKIIYRYSESYRKQVSKVSNMALENVENEMLFRVNSAEKVRQAKFQKEIEQLRIKSIKANMMENSMQPIYNAISMVGVMAIVYLGGMKVIEQIWTVGQFSAYITIFIAFAVKASKAAKLFNSVQKAQVSWKRIKPFLSEYQDNKNQRRMPKGGVDLQVKNLSFRKINDVSFNLKEGQILGVTGPVASGKSTVGISLQGLYDYEGSIMVDGVELRNISHEEMNGKLAYLGHDPQLLSDTIYNNITLGEDGDITDILVDVAFDIDLESMEKGVETVIGSAGIRLSGGQKARVALARTLYNKGEIMVLDDPFSAVDTATEEKIVKNLRQNYKDCAIVLISHRVAAFDQLDQVLYIDEGVGILGSHRSLMDSCLGYQNIYEHQMGGDTYEG